MTTITSYLQQNLSGVVNTYAAVWVRLHNNTSGNDYVSTAATDPNGLFTVSNIPAGSYSIFVGPSSGSTPTATGEVNFLVAPSFDTINSIAYAATITPDASAGQIVSVGTLTGNITVAAPTSPTTGQKLTFLFTQDGTGGRTVTWNAVFKTAWIPSQTASKISSVTFFYDGANWQQEDGASVDDAGNITTKGAIIGSSFTASVGSNTPEPGLPAGGTSTQFLNNDYWLGLPTGADDAANINAVVALAVSGGIKGAVRARPGKTYLLTSNYVDLTVGAVEFDFRGATLKTTAGATYTLMLASNNYPPAILVGAADVKVRSGLIDQSLWVANGGCGIICNGNATRVLIDAVRTINCTQFAYWAPYGIGGVNSVPTDITYRNCRAASSGNAGTSDGGGFKCEGAKIKYHGCIVESTNVFMWDIEPGNAAAGDIELIGCEGISAAAFDSILIGNQGWSDIRILGGYFQAQKPIHVFHNGQRISIAGVHLVANAAGVGTGMNFTTGTLAGLGASVMGCKAYNFATGYQLGAFSGQPAGNLQDITLALNHAIACTTGINLFNNHASAQLLNLRVLDNDVSQSTTGLATFGLNANGGGAGILIDRNLGYNPLAVVTPGVSTPLTNTFGVNIFVSFIANGAGTTFTVNGKALGATPANAQGGFLWPAGTVMSYVGAPASWAFIGL